MPVQRSEVLPIRAEDDVVRVRQGAREFCVAAGFSLVDQTKMVTAASEIARNTLIYGGGGSVTIELHAEGLRHGVRLRFVDTGPGIADLEQALRDGYTSGRGLGLGLGGARRLVNEFQIDSRPGDGTKVSLTRWK